MDSNSSLFRLSHLKSLNLAYNDFSTSEISPNFGNLPNLTHLNLSSSEFSGQVPTNFLRLANLISLDLSLSSQEIKIDPRTFRLLLQNLTQLREIYLSGADISSVVPANISASIEVLSLDGTLLHGKLPNDIFDLPNLKKLELFGNLNLTGQLPMIMKLNSSSNLRYLDLSDTALYGELPESIGNLKLLNYLDFSYCKFWGSIPESIGNLTQINQLILSNNNLTGPLPSTLPRLGQIIRLDLSDNALQGQPPDFFGKFRMLTSLSLASNFLTGSFPSSITNLTQLEDLDLSNNSLTGPIPSRVLGFPKLSLLFLGENSFNGTVPSWIFSLPSLRYLNLGTNELTGEIREFQSPSLLYIDLTENKMYGPIPESISKLKNLTTLYVSSNNFSGNVDVSIFSNLNKLKILDLSFNSLSLTNEEVNSTMPGSLTTLYLASCNITSLEFLRGAEYLSKLDLSNNMIHGELPKWMMIDWKVMYLNYLNLSNNFLTRVNQLPFQGLIYLDLSSNLLQGPLLSPPDTIMVYFASNNNLSGEIPWSICNATSLDVLDLSNNSLSGVIPECLANASSKLTVLDIRMNSLQGPIPGSFGVGSSLRSLNLRDNQLEGAVPKSLSNCRELEVLDLGNNFLNGTFPSWLGSLPNLQVLSLRSNHFHGSLSTSTTALLFPALRIIDLSHNEFNGTLPARLFKNLEGMKRVDRSSSLLYVGGDFYQDSVVMIIKGQEIRLVRILSVFTTIDLSSNKFEWEIPVEIGELFALRGLNLSHNILGGQIPAVLGNLSVLESLDLSSNQLGGRIPQRLTSLTYLAVLNLSENHLVGNIPQSNQFGTFQNDSYAGNPGLCGFPLSKLCIDSSSPTPPTFEEDDEFLSGFTWQAVLIGYSSGLVIGMGVAWLMFFTGKPKWLTKFVHKYGFKRKRRQKEIRWTL
ncbi:hypothetical protein M9H77_10858 [Catharanthus roseus]|uniref:Uncharacterized protein n=1 Tax=Catharanthus roseus TaxID=4058 RepID=A0ACC0BD04_CATRO|nr:hypothetical protein M9H77_10858 [Catharanthus roseus]